MRIYVSADFFASWQFVPWLLVSAVFSAISGYYGAVYGVLKKNINVMVSTVLSALINICLNFLLIPPMGVMGAVVATVISYAFIASFRLFDSRKIFPFPIGFGKLLVMTVDVCASAFCVTYDILSTPVSLSAVILITVLYAKDFKEFIKSFGAWLHKGTEQNESN